MIFMIFHKNYKMFILKTFHFVWIDNFDKTLKVNYLRNFENDKIIWRDG